MTVPPYHDKIERAFGQFERGEGLTPEESRANLQKKKADWLKQQKPNCAIVYQPDVDPIRIMAVLPARAT